MEDGAKRSAVTPAVMIARTREFAVRCKKLCEALPNKPEAWNIRTQLSRCADSVAANYRAAQRARSKREFVAKMGTVEEEIDESSHWIQTIIDSTMAPQTSVADLHDECNQLTAIIVAAIKSARRNMKATPKPSAIRHPPSAILRMGHGFDLHRLEPGLPLIVGGERLEHDRGCAAHSDGDVVYHAVTDAVLGALGQEDIGQLFPDRDPRWKGADSRVFVEEAAKRMRAAGYAIGNLDVTVILQTPRLSPHKAAMRGNLAKLLGCGGTQVNVKGKTHENVDALGENRAIACHAVVLLTPIR